MSVPISTEHRAALDQLGRALAAVLASAADRQSQAADPQAKSSETAGRCRPHGAGDQPAIQHEDHDARPDQEVGAVAFKGDDREAVTTDKV